MMSKDEFHACLRLLLARQPFVPFDVELRDGRRITVQQLPVVFSDGAASFIDPSDGALVEFWHDEVQVLGSLEQGAPA